MQPTITRGRDAYLGPSLRHMYDIVKIGVLRQDAEIRPFQSRLVLERKAYSMQQSSARRSHRQLSPVSFNGTSTQYRMERCIAAASQGDTSEQKVVTGMGKFNHGGVRVERRVEWRGGEVVARADPMGRAGERSVEFFSLAVQLVLVDVILIGTMSAIILIIGMFAMAASSSFAPRRSQNAPSSTTTTCSVAAAAPPRILSQYIPTHNIRRRLQPLIPCQSIPITLDQRQTVHQLCRDIVRKRRSFPRYLIVHKAHTQNVARTKGHDIHGTKGCKDGILVQHLLLGSVIP
mmetsp:Transcript_19626/g.42614  ORF Transcript_19626/g.42614 Transcript_19626/m.42614 type:complete len:290 (+) Transcript_19626:759-1628(+)